MPGLADLVGGAGIGMAGSTIGRAVVELVGDNARLTQDVRESQATVAQGTRGMETSVSRFSTVSKVAMLAAGAAFIKFTVDSIQAASALGEQTNVVRQQFGAASTEVLQFAQNSSKIGVATTEALKAAAGFGGMFDAAGLVNQESADMSIRMVQLAADMASFRDEDPTDMLTRLRSGLAGEAEPLRRFGIFLSADAVALEAVRMGLAETGEELTEAQKIQARYNIILQQTEKAHGDFGRTVGTSLPNQARQLRAEWENTSATFGQSVLPLMLQGAKAANTLLQVIQPLIPFLDEAVLAFLAFKAASFVAPFLLQVGTSMQLTSTSMIAGAPAIRATGTAFTALGRSLPAILTALPLVINYFQAVRESMPRPGEIAREFDVTAAVVEQLADAAKEAADIDFGARIVEVLTPGPHIGNIYRDLHRELLGILQGIATESGLTIDEINRRLASPEGREALSAATRGTGAFEKALRDLLGVSPEVIGAAADRTEAAEDEAKAEAEAARKTREHYLAKLELAGGFLGIQASALSASDAQDELSAAQARVNRLEERGKAGTKAYEEAIRELKDAQVGALQSQIGLREAVGSYAQELADAGVPQERVNRLVRRLGQEAGLSRPEIRELIADVKRYSDRLDGVPDNVSSEFTLHTNQAVQAMQDLLGFAEDKGLTVSGLSPASARITKHMGGPIFGGPGGGPDEVDARLQVGELVWSRDDVAAVGGPAAADDLRRAARRGMPILIEEYHAGGLVHTPHNAGERLDGLGDDAAHYAAILRSLRVAGELGAEWDYAIPQGAQGIVALGRAIQQLGFSVAEHPAFGGVGPGHIFDSYHYWPVNAAQAAAAGYSSPPIVGRAVDVNKAAGTSAGEQAELNWLAGWIRARVNPVELIYPATGDPNHQGHLHAALAEGGFARSPMEALVGDRDEVILPLEDRRTVSALAAALTAALGNIGQRQGRIVIEGTLRQVGRDRVRIEGREVEALDRAVRRAGVFE